MRYWCEFCRDPYDVDHFDANGQHRVGHEFGPEGSLLLAAAIVRAVADCEPMAIRDDDYGADFVCGFCEVLAEVVDPHTWKPVKHKPTCPWRRAKEWVDSYNITPPPNR
jgi:hypothetical protein